jgi:siroheme synthase
VFTKTSILILVATAKISQRISEEFTEIAAKRQLTYPALITIGTVVSLTSIMNSRHEKTGLKRIRSTSDYYSVVN